MKTTLVTISLFLCSLLIKADPPANIKLNYNKKTNALDIVVKHIVDDTQQHYIKEIDINVDTLVTKKISFKKQSFLETQEYSQALPPLKKGNVIKVKAICNQYGTKTAKYIVK